MAHNIYKQTKSEFIHSDLHLICRLSLLFFYHCPWSYCYSGL